MPETKPHPVSAFLFAHQLQMKFRYTHVWTENDVLVWDHLGMVHRAIADYRPDEIRLIRRCQVMATKVFDPLFNARRARWPLRSPLSITASTNEGPISCRRP
jgi:taurine dioxygenase